MPLRAAACLRSISYALLLALAVAAPLVAAAPARADDRAVATAACRSADAQLGQASAAALRRATLCLVNRARRAKVGRALRASRPLAGTGARYARRMVRTGAFSHVDAAGGRVASRVRGGGWSVLGENLGWGTYASATPRSMVQGWLASPTHRANVLFRSFRWFGVGIVAGAPVPGKQAAATYAAVFGRR